MKFERTVVFGDLHGDLDAMLASMAEKGLVRYDGEPDSVMEQLEEGLFSSLEAMVLPQEPPVRVVFLGDFLDRYHFGYHIMRFLDRIRWENFGIHPIFLLGNHDLLNFHFFVNPFELPGIYAECGHRRSETVSYINGMGIDKSLASFKALHADEIAAVQTRFYETGAFQQQETGYTLQFHYPRDLSSLVEHRLADRGYSEYYFKIAAELDVEPDKALKEDTIDGPDILAYCLFRLLGEATAAGDEHQRNWWDIREGRKNDYSRSLSNFNLFTRTADEERSEILPVDWRIISSIWRCHYGNFFRRMRLLHNEGSTLFVHGGISPLAMMDPLAFGNIYDPSKDNFRPLSSQYEYEMSLEKLVKRSNRLMAQVVENALNDYSFKRMNGMELVDQIGYWRGVGHGFPSFGGLVWSDFEYIRRRIGEHERLRQLYRDFKEATGIERIVCGHTHFQLRDKPEVRYLMIGEFQKLGLEYLCIDNACSRAYREEPVLNGIEIDREGRILGAGEVCSSSTF